MDNTIKKRGGVIKHKEVYAKKGNNVTVFSSVIDASEKTGCLKDKIYKCCNGKMMHTGGYEWSYKPFISESESIEWRDCVGYEGIYQVNRNGEVRSCQKGKWHLLSVGISKCGYRHVLLHKDGKRKNLRCNRLVAKAFIPNPDNLPYVNHKDENPSNDNVENLEWCTCEYNVNYGTARERSSRNNGKNRPVCMFDVDGTFIREFYNIANAAKTIGGEHSCILRCCSNKFFCYKGYIWRYKEDIDTIADAIKQYKSANSTNRKIKVIVNGETKIFNSMSQASKELGISRDTLRKYNKIRNILWEII